MKLLKRLKDLLYAIPFGMKAGDELLTTSNVDVDEGSSVHQVMEKKSVLDDLLKGEVTQEVEELRYETFKAEEMSNEYQYVGNGISVKKKGDEEHVSNKRKKFIQYNVDQEYSLSESLGMINRFDLSLIENMVTRKIFKITYDEFVRFKLENYIYKVRVDLTNDSYKTFLYFIDDDLNRNIRPLVNFIKKTKKEVESLKENEIQLRTYKRKNQLYSSIKTFEFTTINASNDVPNGVDYKFTNPTLDNITEEDGFIVLEYSWNDFDGNVLLSERFKSESAEEKFRNKEKREGYIPDVASLTPQEENIEVRDRCQSNIENWVNGDESETYLKIE